jgi:hypothetical protein
LKHKIEGGEERTKKTQSTIGKRQNISTAEVQHGYRYILITRETCGGIHGDTKRGSESKGKTERKKEGEEGEEGERDAFTKKKEKEKKRSTLGQRRKPRGETTGNGKICPFETKGKSEKRQKPIGGTIGMGLEKKGRKNPTQTKGGRGGNPSGSGTKKRKETNP